MNKRVMLVDDHPETLMFLRTCMTYVEPVVEVVGETGDAQRAVAMALEERPDVILMDFVLLGDITGLEASRQILAVLPNTRVILVTGRRDPWLYDKARELGIFGFWRKCEPVAELLNVVAAALQTHGQESITPKQQPILHQALASPTDDDPCQLLTRREAGILALMAEGHTRLEIADRLSVSLNTVKTHRLHIFEKLHVRNRTEAALRFIGLTR